MYGVSGLGARLRLILERPRRRNYITCSYAKKIDIEKWARAIIKVCDAFHEKQIIGSDGNLKSVFKIL